MHEFIGVNYPDQEREEREGREDREDREEREEEVNTVLIQIIVFNKLRYLRGAALASLVKS